jgi:predicted ABC-type ATPase
MAPPVKRPKVILLGVDEFVNADTIARGLSAFAPERVAIAAGRAMMRRLKELAASRANFAFETTLASRSFAPWLADLKRSGYQFHLVFLWLPSEEVALERVAQRVRAGGHDVPATTVRRRFRSGLRNFFELYQPLADRWRDLDNSRVGDPRLVAVGNSRTTEIIHDSDVWNQIQAQFRGG